MVDARRVRELESQRHALAREGKALMLRAIGDVRQATPAEQLRLNELWQQSDHIERQIQALYDA